MRKQKDVENVEFGEKESVSEAEVTDKACAEKIAMIFKQTGTIKGEPSALC